MSKKAVFLDRDGVIIHDPGHLNRKEQVRFLPGAEDLGKLQDNGYILVIVGNQSVVARGLLSKEGIWEIDKFIRKQLNKIGVDIKASYYCPHHPDFTGLCKCRKPKPGLFFQAIEDLNIDPARSIAIGDKPSDIAAGKKAGVKIGILVKRNGERWDATREELAEIGYKADNLSEAIKIIMEKKR